MMRNIALIEKNWIPLRKRSNELWFKKVSACIDLTCIGDVNYEKVNEIPSLSLFTYLH